MVAAPAKACAQALPAIGAREDGEPEAPGRSGEAPGKPADRPSR